jgi:repressor LexA
MNPRARQILAYIKDYVNQHNYPPTVREIGKGVGLKSPATVHRYLRVLEERGLINRQAGTSRTLAVK